MPTVNIFQQDEICLRIRNFIKAKLDDQDVRVWLPPQLGHSWGS